MSHAFKVVPAKPAYGSFSKKLDYSDVLSAKRANTLYCDCNGKDDTNYVNSQGKLMDMKKTTRGNCDDCDVFPFDKTSLQVNLVTTLYIPNILVVEELNDPGKPSKIDPTLIPFFAYYNIDPNDKLVGDTPCGIQKFINYMILDVSAFVNEQCPEENVTTFCPCTY
jgi:hypothetical protein